jgi:hypothetical protein
MDVQVSARGAQIRVTEKRADVHDRHGISDTRPRHGANQVERRTWAPRSIDISSDAQLLVVGTEHGHIAVITRHGVLTVRMTVSELGLNHETSIIRNRHGVDVSKYHETVTRAWIMAVRHFMEISPDSDSSETFIENNPKMLDSRIMMTHYSAEVLFSDEARAKFVEPNLSPIPRYGN